jgi:Prp8 binding protein
MKILGGATHGADKNLIRAAWSPDGRRVAAGSADRCVFVWDLPTQSVIYRLPGHAGTVNSVDFHPLEPILLSCSSDQRLYLGELAD